MTASVIDVWVTLRLLVYRPAFAIVAVLTLGVALGAATAMYSVVHGVALRPLPYPEPERLVQLWQVDERAQQHQFSVPNFEDLRERARGFAALAIYGQAVAPVVLGTQAQRAAVAVVSRDFFDVVGVHPTRGRGFLTEEHASGAAAVALVSHAFWTQHLGARDDLGGISLVVRGAAHAVVGVMPAGFAFPSGVEIWLPFEAAARNPYRTGHNWLVVGRLAGDASLDLARQDVARVAAQLKQELGEATQMHTVALVPLHEEIVGQVRPVLWLLLASVVLLLLVACANLANLLLVRMAARTREIAIRSALGATAGTIFLPLLAEGMAIATAGGLLGVALAWWSMDMVLALTVTDLPRLSEVHLSGQVLAASLVTSLLTGLGLGVISVWRARRPDIIDGLKGMARGETGTAHATRLRRVLVVAQLAVSMVLLIGAGLLGRSLWHLLQQDTGFRTEGVLLVDLSTTAPQPRISSTGVQFDDPLTLPRQADTNTRLMTELARLPGVVAVGGISRPPLGSSYSSGRFVIVRGAGSMDMATMQHLAADPSRSGQAEFRVASAGYFDAMGIPLLRGRPFGAGDTFDAPHVALISRSLASTRWPHEDPIGQRIQFAGMDGDLREFTIVGIVGDIRERFDAPPKPTFYADYRQRPLMTFDFTMAMHTAIDPVPLIGGARQVVSQVSPHSAPRFRTMEHAVSDAIAGRRFALVITGAFAGAAMLLAVLGVYGVMSHLVALRRREFGMRMALGAQRRDVFRLVLGEAGRLFAVGTVLGTAAGLVVGRVLRSALFGVQPTDLVTFAGVFCLLGVASLLACSIPALRATGVDPLTALRAE